MSDFFTRLAERTLGLALIIQPIKPSLFAPELDAGGTTPFEIADESATAQTFSGPWQGFDTPAQRSDPGQAPAQARSVATSAAQSQHAQAEYTGLAVVPARSSTGNIPVETSIPSGGMLAAPSSYRDNEWGSVDVGAWRPQGSPLPYTKTGTRRSIVVATLAVAMPPRIRPLSLQNGGGRELTPAVHPLESAAQLHEQTISSHVVLGERTTRNSQSDVGTRFIASELESIPTPQAQPEASTPEPAIQVTIGRVEVRAVTAPPTTTRSQPQPARPPAMSLDEYLRRQEQGGRR